MLAMLAVGKKYIPAAELVHMRPIPERPFGAGLGRAREGPREGPGKPWLGG